VSPVTERARSTAEVLRALAVLCESPHPSHARVAEALDLGSTPSAADHTQAFVLGAVPYASVYLGPEGMLGGEAADRVAGFWRALGYVPPPEPDHLAALLGLLATLTEAEAGDALTLSLEIRNTADLPQPAPLLDLELLDTQGERVATRRFTPAEYGVGETGRLLAPNESIRVAVAIAAIRTPTSGFKVRLP